LTIDLSYVERQKTEDRRRNVLLPTSCFLLSAIASRHTAMSTFALYELRRMNVWSEKTTVCRIFSCKRAASLHSLAGFAGSLRSARRNLSFYRRRIRSFKPNGKISADPSAVASHYNRRIEPSARLGPWAPAERKGRRPLQTK